MHVAEIFLFISLASNSLCQRIECDWLTEWLCGDQCLGEAEDHLCLCGNDTLTSADSVTHNCCNQETCFKEIDGNVKCQGFKQNWRVPCNGKCKQLASAGLTTTSCVDQKQCVKSIQLCRGVPVCHE